MRAIQHAITHPITRPIGGMDVLNRNNPLGKYEARGVEQHLIERLRVSNPPKVTQAEYKDLGLENGFLENKINSMSKNHRFYDQGTEFEQEWIENRYPDIQ